MFSRIIGLAVVGTAALGLCLAAFNVGLAGDKDKVVKDVVVKDKDVVKDVVVKDKDVVKDVVVKDVVKDTVAKKEAVKDIVKDKDVKKDVVKDKEVKKDDVKDKEKDKKDKKEPPKVELKSVAGEVIIIDFAKGTFTIGQPDNKSRTFTVNDDTKFVGPKGGSRGLGKAGLKDETLIKGAAVRVAFAQDDQVALEVHLPARAATPPKTTPPETVKPPVNKVPETKPPQALPPLVTPPGTAPQLVPQAEWSEPRVGPVRRLFRRLFRGE